MWGKRQSERLKDENRKRMLGNKCAKGTKRPDLIEYNKTHIRKGKDNPNYGNHKLLGISKSIEHKKKIAESHIGMKYSEETKRKVGAKSRLRFNDPEFLKKYKSSLRNCPNKLEKKLGDLLEKMYPREWKFTGDFTVVMDGKSPDFFNIKNQTKLIEVWGNYWHRGQNPEDRKKIFRKFGYDTLVLWERELKNINNIKNKLDEFIKVNY